jgi:hypothetical protein
MPKPRKPNPKSPVHCAAARVVVVEINQVLPFIVRFVSRRTLTGKSITHRDPPRTLVLIVEDVVALVGGHCQYGMTFVLLVAVSDSRISPEARLRDGSLPGLTFHATDAAVSSIPYDSNFGNARLDMAKHSRKWVSYLRVSTDKQGASGLGEAQGELVVAKLNRLARNVAFLCGPPTEGGAPGAPLPARFRLLEPAHRRRIQTTRRRATP